MNNQLLHIFFPNKVQADDLHITQPACANCPGQAALNAARIQPADPAAPNSQPVHSRTGYKIGFLANANLFDPPYTNTYQLTGI